MTDAEWLACTNPDKLLSNLHRKAERKYLLFAVACCRRIWHLMPDERCRRLVEAVDRRIEQQSSEEEWREASLAARQAWTESGVAYAEVFTRRLAGGEPSEQDSATYAHHFATAATWELRHFPSTTPQISATPGWEGYGIALGVARCAATALHDAFLNNPEEARTRQRPWPCSQAIDLDHQNSPERPRQCDLLRDIFGNPFRPVAISLAWRTTTALSLAQAIYQEQAFNRLPILADALEDTGCTSQDILNHCRQSGVHVRGCWAVDLILGKE